MYTASAALENPRGIDQAVTLLDLFAQSCERHPDTTAIAVEGSSLTYRELDVLTDEVAQRLAAAGVAAGSRVGIRVSSGTLALYAGILAVLKAGAAYVPVDADDPDERARAVFDSADVAAVLTDSFDIESRRFDGVTATDRRPVTSSDAAWVIFTSGTTGAPKGVEVSHASAAAFVRAEQKLWSVEPEDRVLAGLSVAFDASCEEIWTAWANGAALVPAPRSIVRSGADLGPWMRERGITVVSTVPTLAAFWGDDVLSGVRLLILGGEALPEELAHHLAEHCEVWNTYGPTEATVVSTAARIRPGVPVTIGGPLEGWLTAVVDDQGRPVPDGEPGELIIGGVGLGRYLDPVLDRERFAPNEHLGWPRAYRSGDIVVATDAGYTFVGRRDDQIKVGGRRIELGEVDAHLTSFPGVATAAAAAREAASGNKLLVAYVVAKPGVRLNTVAIRDHVAARLSGGIAPVVVLVDSLPQKASGKINRKALPWPPAPSSVDDEAELGEAGAWLANRWREQLGPIPLHADSNFFHLGGTSVAAAKLVSVVRERFPQTAVADIYHYPELGALLRRLESLGHGQVVLPRPPNNARRELSAAVHLLGLAGIMMLGALPWVAGVLVFDDVINQAGLPFASLWLIIPPWVLFGTLPGRALTVAAVRRTLLGHIKPGRYPRHSWLGWRLWLIERIGATFNIDHVAGTPWATRAARMAGMDIAKSARLGTLPPITGLVHIGEHVTIEKDVEMHGWYVEGSEIVIADITIEDYAHIAESVIVQPGIRISARAEVEIGAVVGSDVPAGERWAGSPAHRVGRAGELWPQREPNHGQPFSGYVAFFIALLFRETVPGLALLPALFAVSWLLDGSLQDNLAQLVIAAPALGLLFFVIDALLVAIGVRVAGSVLRPGVFRDNGPMAAALWACHGLMQDAIDALFPIFASSFTRPWLRLCGFDLGKGTEMSMTVGLTPLVSIGNGCFFPDAVVFNNDRYRDGWMELRTTRIGNRAFVGNGSLVRGGTDIGDDTLVGVMTLAPYRVPNGTTWFGVPAIEFPRQPLEVDPARTTMPSRRMRALRLLFDSIRIMLPVSVASILAALGYVALVKIGSNHGIGTMIAVAPVLSLGLGALACAFTVTLKWTVIGRYKRATYPFFSTFVWRDEWINSCQEMLSGRWLLGSAVGTPVLNAYMRLMGAKIGKDAYLDTFLITEFDQVSIGESSALNRLACMQTHLFQDRVLQIGPAQIGDGSTIGPKSSVLPDTRIGDDTHVGPGSVLLAGEALPDATWWLGVPVAAAPDHRHDLRPQ